jgi:hypothetical protein
MTRPFLEATNAAPLWALACDMMWVISGAAMRLTN